MHGRKAPRLLAALITMLALSLAAGSPALAAPGVVQDLDGCRDNTLAANDDGSTDLVPLGFTANLFDAAHTEAYVNNNGNITFDSALGEFTPFDFRETGQEIIAPFFADVDTRGAGSGLVHYGSVADFGGADAFCVIWDNVGYYNSHADKLNRFQLLLIDRGTAGVDVIFNYDAITWETGDASSGANGFGGTSGAAGYAAGDGDSAHALMFNGSFVNGGLLDSNAATSLAGHSTAGQPAGRWVFQLRQGAPTGGRLFGDVTTPGGDIAEQAPVEMCRDGGACVTRLTNAAGRYSASNLPAGSYDVTAYPGPGQANGTTTIQDVNVGGPGTEVEQDIELGDPPQAPPDGTEITNIGVNGDGIPVAYWNDPLQLSTQGCAGGAATYRLVLGGAVVRQGGMAEGPAGTYTATIAPLFPNSGDGEIEIDIVCPGAGGTEETDFGIYIDPSGVVRDTHGTLLEGVTVTLLRSAAPEGPFFPVPDGSAIMSPSNRVNPDLSRSDGRFGWDVVAGYYVVLATRDGCVSAADRSQAAATSGVLTIPPPVTNLDLRLFCGEAGPPDTTTQQQQQQQASGGQTPAIVTTTAGASIPVARKLAAIASARLLNGRTLAVKVACAASASQACAGVVKAKIGKKAVGKKRYKGVKAGKRRTVKLALNSRGRALVKKVKPGRKVKFVITVTVKDAAGQGVTVKRTISVRR
jgi:hypothetical protein